VGNNVLIEGAGIESFQQVSAGFACLHQDVHPLAGPDDDRFAGAQFIHVGHGDAVHRNDVQSMTFQGNKKIVALRRIQESPSLHLTRPHAQGGVRGPIGRVIEVATPKRPIQAVGAPDALLFYVGCAEGEGTEPFGFFIDPRHLAVESSPDDLKHHRNVFGSRDLGQCVESSGTSFDNQETRHATVELERDRAVLVRVVPERPAGVIGREIDLYGTRGAWFHVPQWIVRNA
jgi:hypothetical protein